MQIVNTRLVKPSQQMMPQNTRIVASQRFIRPGIAGQQIISNVQHPTQMMVGQQQQQQQQRIQINQMVNPDGQYVNPLMMQQGSNVSTTSQTDQQNIALIAQRLAGEGESHVQAARLAAAQRPAIHQAATSSSHEGQEIPDAMTAELEKFVKDENAGIEDDILGGLDDDDELLDSLTAEMGADFNILEYADPELDTNEKSNLLDFDLDEPEAEKADDKAKTEANK
jgi:histone-lysine N-methyltransferase MLL3